MEEIRGNLRILQFLTLDDEPTVIAALAALCPACGFEHMFNVDLTGHGKHHNHVGTFNGDYERPTFRPSMGYNMHNQVEHHSRCHSWLTDGVWQFLGDCTHDMAGRQIPMVPPDPGMSFERRAGWHLYPWCDENGQPKELP